jgi:argininosuccinate lyase
MKGLPLSYNRDMQEDKEGFFDTVDTLQSTLEVCTGMLQTLRINAERMHQAAGENYTLATDLADYLAKKGVPFREAHKIVGEIVRFAIEKGSALHELSIEDYRRFSPLFGEDALKNLTVESSIAARDVPGGTAPRQVEEALRRARRKLDET